MGFSSLDVMIVLIYLAGSIGAGLWIGRGQKNTADYFLGGRKIPWWAVTFSIVATETSVLSFISIPAISYLGNLTFLQIALGYVVGRFLVAAVMIPRYYKGEIETAYHFLGSRFGDLTRKATSITFMITRLLADGVRLFATAIPLTLILKSSSSFAGIPDSRLYAVAIIVIGIVTILYTYVGGIRSVIWMDVVQMSVYLAGALMAGALILSHLPGGWSDVIAVAEPGGKLEWIYLGSDLSLSAFIKQPYTFFTAVIAGAIFSMASHGTDQLIVQRALCCRDRSASQMAMATSGIAVFLQFALFLILGILLYAFYQGASLEALDLTRADGIFPKFIIEEMPAGLSGLIVAALFAAAMSSLSSSLSSLSSAAVLDIYIPMAGAGRSEAELLKISRMTTLVWGIVLVIAALFFIGLEGTVVEVALGIASYTYGGLLGIFLLGLMNDKAEQIDAIIGFFTALLMMLFVKAFVEVAWPLYTVIGSITVVATGVASYHLRRLKRTH